MSRENLLKTWNRSLLVLSFLGLFQWEVRNIIPLGKKGIFDKFYEDSIEVEQNTVMFILQFLKIVGNIIMKHKNVGKCKQLEMNHLRR